LTVDPTCSRIAARNIASPISRLWPRSPGLRSRPCSAARWLRFGARPGRAATIYFAQSSDCDDSANAITVLARVFRGERRLVFAESRSRVEQVTEGLRTAGVRTFASHASLSLDERRAAEAAFADEPDCVIVATSTLELGIDVGDLDRVVQVGAPSSTTSFLQRMGRTGRRTGASGTASSSPLMTKSCSRRWRSPHSGAKARSTPLHHQRDRRTSTRSR
jgi:superfamily II DNA or RNA helicase